MRRINYLLITVLLTAITLIGCKPDAPKVNKSEPQTIQILAINDFHGALLPPNNGEVGGVASIATLVSQLRDEQPNTIVVGVGDLVGASPLLSAMFNDEPTIEAMNLLGMEASSVGNHEFDKGRQELLRKQTGGCHAITGCFNTHPFIGADFQYLSANVIDKETGATLLPAYYIKDIVGTKIAFIGVTLEGTANIVSAAGTQGLLFMNEVTTINQQIAQLQALGINNIGILLHEGATQQSTDANINSCDNISGKAVDIVNQLDKRVAFVFSGHTHQYYNCVINEIPFISGQSNGTIVSQLLLSVDTNNHSIIDVTANNILVDNQKYAPDAAMTKMLTDYQIRSEQVSQQVMGNLQVNLDKTLTEHGDSLLGRVISDAQLYATTNTDEGGAQIAFNNSGGIRAPLKAGEITYSDIYTVQPFSNILVTKTLTGQQLKNLLEQQWDRSRPQVMPTSTGFYYEWDDSRAAGDKVLVDSMSLNGKKITMDGTYRIVANEYLAEGGSYFTEFQSGTNPVYSLLDNEALMKYFTDNSPIAEPTDIRIKRLK